MRNYNAFENNSSPSGRIIGIKRKPCEVSQSLLRKPSLNSDTLSEIFAYAKTQRGKEYGIKK